MAEQRICQEGLRQTVAIRGKMRTTSVQISCQEKTRKANLDHKRSYAASAMLGSPEPSGPAGSIKLQHRFRILRLLSSLMKALESFPDRLTRLRLRMASQTQRPASSASPANLDFRLSLQQA
jgi:hypothetical protein